MDGKRDVDKVISLNHLLSILQGGEAEACWDSGRSQECYMKVKSSLENRKKNRSERVSKMGDDLPYLNNLDAKYGTTRLYLVSELIIGVFWAEHEFYQSKCNHSSSHCSSTWLTLLFKWQIQQVGGVKGFLLRKWIYLCWKWRCMSRPSIGAAWIHQGSHSPGMRESYSLNCLEVANNAPDHNSFIMPECMIGVRQGLRWGWHQTANCSRQDKLRSDRKREVAFRDPDGILEGGPTVRVPSTANDSNDLENHTPRGADECIKI